MLVLGAGAGAGAVLGCAGLASTAGQTDRQTNDLDRRAGQGRQAGRTRSDCLHCSLASKVTAAIGDLETCRCEKGVGRKKMEKKTKAKKKWISHA